MFDEFDVSRLLVPLIQTGVNDDKFVSPDIYPYKEFTYDGIPYKTSFLATNKKINLFGVSCTQELIDSGVINQCDSIKPKIMLRSLLVRLGSDVFEIKVDIEIPCAYEENHGLYSLRKDIDIRNFIKLGEVPPSIIKLQLDINVETCTVQTFTNSPDGKTELLGFKLLTERACHG